jgi:DNA-binding NarL/FixJ family response regulator
MIKVAIVEDTDSIRSSLEKLIKKSDGFELVASYFNAVQAISDLPKRDVNVVLMDVSMPGLNGIEAVTMLKEKMNGTQFLMITVHDDHETIVTVLKSGASGYIVKKSSDEHILKAIREMHDGGAPMSQDIARKLIDALQKIRQPKDEKLRQLSDRERDIFKLLCNGDTYEAMARKLYISKETIKKHVSNIYKKLGVESRAEAMNRYKRG